MSSYMRTYSNFQEVKLLPIDERPFQKDRYFPKEHESDINQLVSSQKHTNI